MSSYEGLCHDCQQVECDEACMKATSNGRPWQACPDCGYTDPSGTDESCPECGGPLTGGDEEP